VFLLDDILLAPVKGVYWICKELYKEAEKQIETEEGDLTTQLSELYMMLETGTITEEEFSRQEKNLLDRLEQIERHRTRDEEDKE